MPPRIDLAEFLGPLVSETLDPGEVGAVPLGSATRFLGEFVRRHCCRQSGVLCRTGQGH